MPVCRACHGDNLYPFLSLGQMPLANNFLRYDQLGTPEPCYPLDVYFCGACGLVQLDYTVPRESMFTEYAYLTGASKPLLTHFAGLAQEIIRDFNIPRGSFIIDIGSNDGTLLSSFKESGMNVQGIEPALNVSRLALTRGIDTVNGFFDSRLARQIASDRGKAHVITATNVFAHVPSMDGFLHGITNLLDENGIFVIEVPYLADLLAKLEFDTIYHEHLAYFSLRPLSHLLDRFNLVIISVKRVAVHGGSLRVYVTNSVNFRSTSASDLIREEHEQKLGSLDTYLEFARRVSQIRDDLTALVRALKKSGARIAGYGAPAKGNVLLNYCQLGTDILDYITDTTPFKQGMYTPGIHVPVFPESHFHRNPPDYALLLAWNYLDDILEKEALYRSTGGRFIIPVPEPQII